MRTNKQTRRFVSWVLTLAMVLGLLAGTTVGVWADIDSCVLCLDYCLWDEVNNCPNYDDVSNQYIEPENLGENSLLTPDFSIVDNEDEITSWKIWSDNENDYVAGVEISTGSTIYISSGASINDINFDGITFNVRQINEWSSEVDIIKNGQVVYTHNSKTIELVAQFNGSSSSHDHSWTYSATGSSIIAKCGNDGCDITSGLTLTISAPKDLTYDGTAKAATVNTDFNTTAFPSSPYAIGYSDGKKTLAGAPTDAGTYTATLIAEGQEASVEYTIDPASLAQGTTITLDPTSYVYNWQEATPDVTVKHNGDTLTKSDDYEVSYKNNFVVGTATVTVTGKGNYKDEATTTFAITKASDSEIAANQPEDLKVKLLSTAAGINESDPQRTYLTAELSWTSPTQGMLDLVQYSYVDGSDHCIYGANPWATIEQGAPVGNAYTVEDGVAKATLTIPVLNNGEEKGSYHSGMGTYQQYYSDGIYEGGDFTVALFTTEYSYATVTATYTAQNVIDQAVFTASGSGSSEQYATVTTAPTAITGLKVINKDTPQKLVTAGEAKNGTMQYVIGENGKTAPTSGWTASLPEAAGVGTYYVWYKAAGNSGYNDSTPDFVEATIASHVTGITLDPTALSLVVGEEKSVEATFTDDGTESYWYNISWEASDESIATLGGENKTCIVKGVAPGKTTVTAIVDGVVSAECAVTIKGAPTVSLADKTATYTGIDAVIEPAVVKFGDTVLKDASVNYVYATDSEFRSIVDVHKAVGTYYVKATVDESETYAAATSNIATLTIDPAQVKITGVTAENKMYDGNTDVVLSTVSAIMDGVAEGEPLGFTVSGSFENAEIGQNIKVPLTFALAGEDSVKANYVLSADCQKETTANIMGAEVQAVAADAAVSAADVEISGTTEGQAAAEAAVEQLTTDSGIQAKDTATYTGLTVAAENVAADNDVLDAAAQIATEQGITINDSNKLKIVPGLNVEVKKVDTEGSTVSSITLDINGKYEVVATDQNSQDVKLTEGAMTVDKPIKLAVAVPWDTAWVRHTHNGRVRNYEATVSNGVAEFTSTQGCSEFVLSPTSNSVAYIKNSGVNQYYDDLASAIADLASSSDNTIYLIADASTTVSQEITFTVSKGAFTCTLTPGTNYEKTETGTEPVITYTFTYHAPQTTGGGGGSSAKTETVQNADGSTTTTTTNADGSKVAVTKATNGTTVTVNTDKNGNVTSVAANVSAQAAQDAAKTGEAVALPGTIAKGQNVKVTVPAGSDVKVAIPVSGANAGTVLYAVDAAGNKTLIKDTAYENGKLVINVKQTATIVAGDNAKSFADVLSGRWSKNAVDFVTARELFNGTGATTFGPTETMTRGMLMTVLARYEGVDAYGSDWMEKGMAWSVSKGISDGSEPNRPITRQEIVTMMWRLAGSPVAGAQAASVLAAKPDGAKVADWAQAAMAWALENKVMNGNDKGYVNPESPATREEVAQFLMNYICR